MALCTSRRICWQGYVILLAAFLLIQPLIEFNSLNVSRLSPVGSASSLMVLAGCLSPLGSSLQSTRPDSGDSTMVSGLGTRLLLPSPGLIQTTVNKARRRLGANQAPYIARYIPIQTGRSPPPIVS
jgi:hypothetical protein